MPEYARVCQSMPEYARVCQSMPEYARVCQSMSEYARVCKSMQEYARVCPSMLFLTFFFFLLILCSPTTTLSGKKGKVDHELTFNQEVNGRERWIPIYIHNITKTGNLLARNHIFSRHSTLGKIFSKQLLDFSSDFTRWWRGQSYNRRLLLAPSSTVKILFFTENTMFCTSIKDLVRKSMVELFCAGTKSKLDTFCLHQNKAKCQHEKACIWLLLKAISFVKCEWWIYSQLVRLIFLEGRKKNMNTS